ncbi:MAG: 1-(5-phosphoribosyl)-5-[(5-phosphoribosylamino)methylideneamino]imidazole-4-carboxamide isomerase [Gammaproteobacteria bacterium]|nr:MAG: 1-(5-phosphoribosyl)-5-[(5-phosphoribosylamino)methylideneamino]imidazole-4-carboxamide isomerase [Gammaproteobacteria bacterium]
MKIIPAIDLRQGQCVRLFQGDFDRQTIYGKDPVALAGSYQTMGFSNLHIVDLDGARSGQQENQAIIRSIIDSSELAVQVGGGIRSAQQLESWLDAGVARVVIGSLAIIRPRLVSEWLVSYGPEKIVLALDVTLDETGTPQLATHGWTRPGNITLWQCIDTYLDVGLQHVLCTDISRDGAMTGPNIELYAQLIGKYPQIQLQASGGVRDINDLKALDRIGLPAAISGRALLDGKIDSTELTTFLPAA